MSRARQEVPGVPRGADHHFQEVQLLEIEETINRLRREISGADRTLEGFDKELRDLGGFLKDRNRGLIYFYSERGGRKVFLIWELRCPDLLYWHELDETFADRLPVDFPEGARASALDFPRHP